MEGREEWKVEGRAGDRRVTYRGVSDRKDKGGMRRQGRKRDAYQISYPVFYIQWLYNVAAGTMEAVYYHGKGIQEYVSIASISLNGVYSGCCHMS